MEQQITVADGNEVKAFIAKRYLQAASTTTISQLGTITLHPHQVSAVRRLRAAISEFGGALLADEVGMGKTFVALALARYFTHAVIIAPASLRDMWTEQSRRAGITLPFFSFESLSRRERQIAAFDLVIIDEAHHARNPSTIRYEEISRLIARANVLMMTATPLHNSKQDMTSLLALFLGSRAGALTPSEMTRCVVRRRIASLEDTGVIPHSDELEWIELNDDGEIPRRLLALPPPLPVRDSGDGGVLITRALVRQWCSSDAALEGALTRRLARSLALRNALESGSYPSAEELSAWTFAEDSIQLAFPSLVSTPTGNCAELLAAVTRHEQSIRAVLELVRGNHSRDRRRAQILQKIKAKHAGLPMVAFSQYADTVDGLFRELRSVARVAALTAKGARVAGGPITRRDALSRFAPDATHASKPREAERIDVLLTTDLLSEGVNLQDAAVVVHLDLPWTGARLEQRLGRVRRLESKHKKVFSYGVRPSRASEVLIGLEAVIRRKLRDAEESVGAFAPLLPSDAGLDEVALMRDPLSIAEKIRTILADWAQQTKTKVPDLAASETIAVGAVRAREAGFLALCRKESRMTLVASDATGLVESQARVLDLIKSAGSGCVIPATNKITRSLESIAKSFIVDDALGPTNENTSSVAQTRRKAIRRIATITQRARPHARQHVLTLASRARDAVLGRLGRADENDLLDFASSPIGDEEWLTAVVDRYAAPKKGSSLDSQSHRVIALLLLEPSTH